MEDKAEMEDKKPAYIKGLSAIYVYSTTIEKHYKPSSAFHKDSIRTIKSGGSTLIYIGCPKTEKWASPSDCSHQEVIMTVVAKTRANMDKLNHLLELHHGLKSIVHYKEKEVGTEARTEEDNELRRVQEALSKVEVV